MAEMSPLRRRMIEDMTVRNLSPATQQSYLYAVAKFSRYFGRSPDRLGLDDIHAFQVHLVSKGISWSGLNQIVCALRFLYGVTLGQDTIPEHIPYAREPRQLPVVLSSDEVVEFLQAVSSLKARVALTTAYAAGLRVSEVCGLHVNDIDSSRMVIHITRGKGGKARYLARNLYKIWNRMSSGAYFPPPVRAVSIPKKAGGERVLGVPTVSDRIAQMVVKQMIEPDLDSLFLPDSYGYRPGKSALDAVGVTRQRCWKYDWVLEFDIKGLFDNLPHDFLLKAVRKHVTCKWALLYIERWLRGADGEEW
ncbi:reverse transcriptase domain-containing protein [Rhizobium sp. SG570]|uniref:reverse transcriptase domain-containing protein n=1 Tax=Rhizobium sp. SG570 TaxID=2587113 RepID=UPI0018369212|nr:integrase [Rhizobium sp. SG570]